MTCGVYFGKSTDAIRIGEGIVIEKRTKTHQSSCLSYTVPFILECRKEERKLEEKLAQEFFKKYHLKGSFFSLEIEDLIPEYIENRKEIKEQKNIKKASRGKLNTLYGEESLSDLLPRCSFFPEETVGYMGKKDSIKGLKFRTILINNKRVPVSEKFHKQIYIPLRQQWKKEKKHA